jgi:hypothetical protein
MLAHWVENFRKSIKTKVVHSSMQVEGNCTSCILNACMLDLNPSL